MNPSEESSWKLDWSLTPCMCSCVCSYLKKQIDGFWLRLQTHVCFEAPKNHSGVWYSFGQAFQASLIWVWLLVLTVPQWGCFEGKREPPILGAPQTNSFESMIVRKTKKQHMVKPKSNQTKQASVPSRWSKLALRPARPPTTTPFPAERVTTSFPVTHSI